jgi:hypothetical protein
MIGRPRCGTPPDLSTPTVRALRSRGGWAALRGFSQSVAPALICCVVQRIRACCMLHAISLGGCGVCVLENVTRGASPGMVAAAISMVQQRISGGPCARGVAVPASPGPAAVDGAGREPRRCRTGARTRGSGAERDARRSTFKRLPRLGKPSVNGRYRCAFAAMLPRWRHICPESTGDAGCQCLDLRRRAADDDRPSSGWRESRTV